MKNLYIVFLIKNNNSSITYNKKKEYITPFYISNVDPSGRHL